MPLNISGVVLEGGILVTSPPVPTATANIITQAINRNASMTPYTPLLATGGTAPYTYFVSAGILPTGITLNSTTGQLTGIPTSIYGPNNITFSVKDNNGQISTVVATVSFTVQSAPYVVSYLIVAGGGGSGGSRGTPTNSTTSNGRGGGGAGGFLTGTITLTPNITYTVTVGAGGTTRVGVPGPGVPGNNANGFSGGASSIVASAPGTSLTTAGGGGGGGSADSTPLPSPGGTGQPGGSGGGSGWGGGTGGTGVSGQGSPGGSGGASRTPGFRSGGGGGAGSPGVAGNPAGGGGGPGIYSSITGANIGYAGGGPNSVNPGPTTFGSTPNRINSGSGGSAGSGQSGVVIISIPTNQYTGITSGSVSINIVGSTTVLTFTGSGTYTA